MNYADLRTSLLVLGIPVAYRMFPVGDAPELPYIIFYKEGSDDFYADNINYHKIDDVSIELYTTNKDFELEAKMEKLLENIKLPYASYESYLDDEKMHEVLYEIQI